MGLRPLHDRMLVKRLDEAEEQSQGGIIIPDTAKEKPQQATVLAIGTGRITDDGQVQPLDVKAGDKVVFSKYAGTEVKIDGDELLVIREDDRTVRETCGSEQILEDWMFLTSKHSHSNIISMMKMILPQSVPTPSTALQKIVRGTFG